MSKKIKLLCSTCNRVIYKFPSAVRERNFCNRFCQNPKTLEQRYYEKVDKRDPDECWPWLASTNSSGYGHIRVGDKIEEAHRVGYELECGPIPEGMLVCHTCDNPPCQNPVHWFTGTNADNNADKDMKGRGNQPRGENNIFAKLKEMQVLEIFNLKGKELQYITAERYNITSSMVGYIQNKKNWAWLTENL